MTPGTDGAEDVQHSLNARYARARRYLLVATVVLASVAVYLIATGRTQVWSAAHKNLLSLALGIESSDSALLEQSMSSLNALSATLASRPADDATAVEHLRAAVRVDPDSAYIGFQRGDAAPPWVLDHQGRYLDARSREELAAALGPSRIGGVELGELMQMPGQPEWYLPLTLRLPERTASRVFALVPLSRLIGSTRALDLVPDSRITLITEAGGRPFIFNPSAGYLIPNGPAGSVVMHALQGRDSGSFEFVAQMDNAGRVAGFAHSRVLPFYVMVSVRTSTLYGMWLRQSAAPAIILVLAMLAVIVFAAHLSAAVADQQRHASVQAYRASHDALTGLLNREAFMRRIAQATDIGPSHPFVVLLLDLNRFKEINDTLGHAAGDRVLEEVGRRLGESLHSVSCVARLGGDELAILAVGDYTGDALDELVGEIQAALEQPIPMAGVAIDVSASMGAALHPQDARTPIELLRRADIAMYAAKSDLRPVRRYAAALDNFTPETLSLQGELARALREGVIRVVYQPKIRLSDGALVGLEALARWTHPTIGIVPPSRFVQIAESTELIHPFTRYILERVAEQSAEWQRQGLALPISVNVSANNLLDPDFVGAVANILDAHRLPGRLIELEVTEGALMRHTDLILKRLQEIRELGVALAIDDFGTGYASLAYLKRLPVQTLKIDKSFVLNLASDSADQRIVRSTIQLAHSFGMQVVAEGVETEAIAQRLRNKRCDLAQGYHFGRPQPAAEIERHWLARRVPPVSAQIIPLR